MVTGFVLALVLGIPTTALAAFGSEKPRQAVLGGAAAAGVAFVFNWILFYFALPTVGLSMDTFWQSFWIIFLEAVALLAAAIFAGDDHYNGFDMSFTSGVATAVLGIMLAGWIFSGIWGTDRAHFMSGQLQVTAADPGTVDNPDAKTAQQLKSFDESDPDHIPLLSPEMAANKASQGMNQITTIDVGTFHGNASSVYKLGDGAFQSVGGHAYYLFPAQPSGWRNSGKVDGNVPFYMQVDAENPDLTAVAVTKDKDGKPIDIQYSPGGYFGHDLMRHVWNQYHGKVLSDPTLEVDDRGRPYYTLTLDKLTLNTQNTVPSKLLLVDAQTGVIQEKALNDVPDWVDRVYSLRTAKDLVSWWGEWNSATWQVNESSANRYKLAKDEDPVIVYTKGGHPAWQAILTSYNTDTSAAYLIMMDARSNKATSFQIPGLTLESVASGAIRKAAAQSHLVATHMVLYVVYGQLTWVSPLEGENDDNHGYQGVALVSATDPNGASVVYARSKAAALSQYRQKVAQGVGTNAGPQAGGHDKTAQGTVTYVNPIVEGANGNVSTVFYFGLTDSDPTKAAELAKHIFKGTPSDTAPELRSIHPGAKVSISYLDVGAYDDLGIQPAPAK